MTAPLLQPHHAPDAPEARLAAMASQAVAGAAPDAADVVRLVLQMLRERMGMDVVFVSHFTEGERRFRVVEAATHGRAAAHAAGQVAGGDVAGTAMNIPIVLRDGRVYGTLCCFSAGADDAITERDLRSLRYSARLAARLLDNLQILRDLSRRSITH